ncbi:YfiR family protein [Pseudoduganella lutea]|uniref:YfiR family protein n=1 Tax=Pseudoduganella lutea TaxID=321985 RepID=A0A4P6KSI0_9BURK|nr:YfiR family protein [Pseudoduganella lutea]QBE62081.1 YfiR family protein [Pseudoduganella lutea]
MTPLAIEPCRRTAPHNWPGWLSVLLVLALALLCLAMSGAAVGQTAAPAMPNLERSVKAAYLFKFLGYVDFLAPREGAESGSPLTVGVLGAEDVAAELSRITAGRTVNGRPIAVRSLREGEPVAGLQMLYAGTATDLPKVLRSAAQNGALGVADDENGLQHGAVINFRIVEDRVRFEVSLPAAERSNLKLSSRLLSVAWHVQKGN